MMMMTIVLQDAQRLKGRFDEKSYIVTPDVVYADDTMVVGSSLQDVQKYVDSISLVGKPTD